MKFYFCETAVNFEAPALGSSLFS